MRGAFLAIRKFFYGEAVIHNQAYQAALYILHQPSVFFSEQCDSGDSETRMVYTETKRIPRIFGNELTCCILSLSMMKQLSILFMDHDIQFACVDRTVHFSNVPLTCKQAGGWGRRDHERRPSLCTEVNMAYEYSNSYHITSAGSC